ncbi:hypothetical protein [Apibacter muscae]|uniref:hypothetical protein n=1 Tax=Apibacter muscae TaxID=2509004 RepID=UPI001625D891|nr:hypothetical protein [Apibacter muscae]
MNEFKSKLNSWKKSIETQVENYPDIKKFEINLFLMPFDSVEEMRNEFLKLFN